MIHNTNPIVMVHKQISGIVSPVVKKWAKTPNIMYTISQRHIFNSDNKDQQSFRWILKKKLQIDTQDYKVLK